MNFWAMAKNLFWEIKVTFDHQILIASSLSPSGRLCQIWRIYYMVFLRYRVHEKTEYNERMIARVSQGDSDKYFRECVRIMNSYKNIF